MSFPVESFWRLVVEAQLLTLEECHMHHAAWLQQQPQGGDAQTLAEYLVTANVISRYQASILLAGRAGPFVYGDYRIYERIESGRLAGIFRAVHIATMHRVCLQFLTGEQAASPETVAFLAQRATIVSRSSAGFPHLLRCYQLVDLGAFKFFVLEDLLGKRIERILQQQGLMKAGEACRVTRQAALGLARLHGMQMAHGDVRPQNIWVDASGTVKMLQFPLSRDPLAPPIDWRKSLAAAGEKPPVEADYIAPELIAGGAPDARSDIYQLGCSLYQMLTNKPPFPGDSLKAKLEGHLKGQPTPIEKLNPKVPPELAKLVSYMMQKKPDMRYQQMTSVIEKLLPFMSIIEAQSQPAAPTRASVAFDTWLMSALQAGPQMNPGPMGSPGSSGLGMPQTAAMAQQAPTAGGGYAQHPGMAGPAMSAGPSMQPAAPFGAPTHAGGMHSPAGPNLGAAPQTSIMAERIRKRKEQSIRNLIGLVVVLGILVVVGVIFRGKIMEFVNPPETAEKPASATPSATATKPVATATAKPSATVAAAPARSLYPKRDEIGAIGTDPMYDSPTAGKPLNLAHLVPGVQMIVALRPAELVKQPEFEHLADSKVLGSLGAWLTTTLPTITGVTNDKIDQLLIGILDGAAADAVRYAYVVRMKEASPEADLVKAWGNPTIEKSGEVDFYAKGTDAYYLPKSEGGKVLVVVPKEEMANLLKYQGSAPQLRPELEYLVMQTSDADRHFNLLYTPYFLESGGRSLVSGAGTKLMPAISWLYTGVGLPPLAMAEGEGEPPAAGMGGTELAQPPKAVAVSAHLADTFFYEVRIHNPAATAYAEALAEPLLTRVKEIPRRMEDYVFSLNFSQYSRRMLAKFPGMVKFADNHVRVGTGDRQFVLRGYLPAVAAHNLVLGAHLCLLESPGAGMVATAGGPAAPAAPAKQGVLDMMRTKKMALSFDRNDLNKVLDIVSTEIGIPIEMVGPDFLTAGITKNQSMGLMEPEQTVDKLLQTILLKADKDGRLVYIVKPRNPGEEEMIFIATRIGAASRNEKLLPEFEKAADPKKK